MVEPPLLIMNWKIALLALLLLGLDDAYSIGNHFTWSKGTIWSKLVRVLLNPLLYNLNMDCLLEFLQFNTLSDHTHMVVNLSNHQQKLKDCSTNRS